LQRLTSYGLRPQLDRDSVELTRKPEWHLVGAILDHWRAGVLAGVEGFVE
jgi:hypothetical protein